MMSEFDAHLDEWPESGDDVQCKYCGREGLQWDHNHHDATGRWRLWEGVWPDGKPHVCKQKAQDDFEAIE